MTIFNLQRQPIVVELTATGRLVLGLGLAATFHALIVKRIRLVDDQDVLIELGKRAILPLASIDDILEFVPLVDTLTAQVTEYLVNGFLVSLLFFKGSLEWAVTLVHVVEVDEE